MNWISFAVCGVCAVYLIASTPVTGLGRYLAPDSVAGLTLFAIFGLRPLFTDRFSDRTLYGYIPTDAGQQTAMIVGMVGMVALAFGALCATRARSRPRPASPTKPHWELNMKSSHVIFFTLGSSLLYLAGFAAIAGVQSLQALSGGRSENVHLEGVPEALLILPMAGPIVVALFLAFRRGKPISRSEVLVLVAAVATSLIQLSQLGNRRFIIPALLIPAIAALMRRPTRVRVWHVAFAFITFAFAAIVPMVRSAGARSAGENLLSASFRYFGDVGLSGTFRPVLASYDTEMFDFIALFASPSSLPFGDFGYGRGTVLEFFTRPLPSAWVPNGPFSDLILSMKWRGGCAEGVCPVASLPGVLYFDGGLLLVGLGCLLAGVFLRRLATAWRDNAALPPLRTACVAIASGFALVATRTNTVHAAWWVIYALLIAAVVYWLLARRPPKLSPSVQDRRQVARS